MQNNFEFKVTLKQQLLVLLSFFTTMLILGAAFFYVVNVMNIYSYTGLIIIGYVVFVVTIAPVIVLHIQYLIKNYNSKLIINKEKKVVEFIKGSKKSVFSFQEIVALDYYATEGHFSKTFISTWYTFGSYRFYTIRTKDEDIVITCLMINNIDHVLEDLLAVEAKRNYRMIPLI